MNSTDTGEPDGNPFPGLRPFREEEEYLFFGRESQVDAMVDKLAATRFLAVVGTSGSGKSSLVNCGLRPALRRGLMARAGTAWRMAQFRPGSHPLRPLAQALAQDGVLFHNYDAASLSLVEIVETTLRLSKLGLIDIYEQARLGADVNLLVVVDQFEELFRYRQLGAVEAADGSGAEATALVNLLLEASQQTSFPIHVVLTMRSDFLGDCAQFPGLAEAINAGQYLVPRMTRDERRAAITGPAKVGGAEISPVLLTRLVNDVGDNPDQLSILQHALNRTWARWQHEGGGTGSLDLAHYEAIGTMAHALDRHAEKAFGELGSDRERQICEKLFKALTDKATDPRGVRRPTTLGTLCAVADATAAEITQVISVFRKPTRSFLMPPLADALSEATVLDISHESLMRVWQRLQHWADEEAQSAHIYRRLAETAMLHRQDRAGLWRQPDLGIALKWRAVQKPNPAWAQRYHPAYSAAMEFLEDSEAEARAEVEERVRTLRIRRTVYLATLLALLTSLLGWLLYAQVRSERELEQQRRAWEDQIRSEQASAAREAHEQTLLTALFALRESQPQDAAQFQSTKHKLDGLGPAQVHRDIAEKLESNLKLAPEQRSLLHLYDTLQQGDLAEAQRTYLDLIRDSSEVLPTAKVAWVDWANVKKAEARERTLVGSLYDLNQTRAPQSKAKEVVRPWLSSLRSLDESLFVKPVDFDVASKLFGSKPIEPEGELLARYYSALDHAAAGSPEETLKELVTNHPNTLHALAAQSGQWSAKEARDRRFISYLDGKSRAQTTGAAVSDAGQGVSDRLGGRTSLGRVWHRTADQQANNERLAAMYANERSELDEHAFANPVHFAIACKLAPSAKLEVRGRPVGCTLTDASSPLFPEERTLVDVYAALQSGDKSTATEKLQSFQRTNSYVPAHYLLAVSAVGDPELPTRPSLFDQIAATLSDLTFLIAVLLIWPLWVGWQWTRRRLGKHVGIKARPNPIRRLLAGLADIGIALAAGSLLGAFFGVLGWTIAGVASGTYLARGEAAAWAIGIPVGACAAIAYLLLRDAVKYRFYRSIGKVLFSLRPVLTGPDQGVVTLKVSAKRNALLLLAVAMLPLTVILIFISPLLALGCLLLILGFFAAEFALSASKDGRTLHDRLAKTTVIDIRSDEAKAIDLEMRRGEGSRRAASVK